MKEKTAAEQNAANKEVELISAALEKARINGGYWLNTTSRMPPKFYPKGVSIRAFNALTLGLHSEQGGYKSALYTTFKDAKNQDAAVLAKQQSAPFHWYNWNKYVNRNKPDEIITREQYNQLSTKEKEQYKGIHNREIVNLFNIDQTTFPMVDKDRYQKVLETFGNNEERLHTTNEETKLRMSVNAFMLNVRDNLVNIRRDTSGVARYDSSKDAIYMPDQKHFIHYYDYVQELMRQVVTATGHQQRLSREGMVMKGAQSPSENAEKYESLIAELASGVKMQELGLPAKLSPENMRLIDFWQRELAENPCLIDAVESDVNTAIDTIRKAEKGEEVRYRTEENQEQILKERELQRPQVDSRECAIMLDIIRQGGMRIDDRNFASPEERSAFMQKFDLDYYETEMRYGLSKTDSDDPEVVEIAYTKAVGEGARISALLSEYMPSEWNVKNGNYVIADALQNVPDKKTKEIVVVKDTKTGITDVILPACAATGGFIQLPNGEKRPYHLTPDEVMSESERDAANAKVIKNDLAGFNKERIEAALLKCGSSYVRFFNNNGSLGYKPDDTYFENKEVTIEKLKGWDLKTESKLDVTDAVNRSLSPIFDHIQMMKDDKNRWAMYLKPQNEDGFCIYPDKTDLNQFFSTIKQNQMEESQHLRQELAMKYYIMTQNRSDLKFNLFDMGVSKEDTDKIAHVSIFRTRDDKLLCLPTIDGSEKLKPREITQQQWQRMWIAQDMTLYKNQLAAKLFADVLHPELKKEETKGIESGEVKMIPIPNLKQYEELKAKHPDAVLLFRVGDRYQSYSDDAKLSSNVLNIPILQGEDTTSKKKVEVTSFRYGELDTYLPKLIRDGNRVAICDQLEVPKQSVQDTPKQDSQEDTKIEMNEEIHSGRHM